MVLRNMDSLAIHFFSPNPILWPTYIKKFCRNDFEYMTRIGQTFRKLICIFMTITFRRLIRKYHHRRLFLLGI